MRGREFSGEAGATLPHALTSSDDCECDGSLHGPMCNGTSAASRESELHSVLASTLSLCSVPFSAVGNLANFCLPPAGYVPNTVPPPGQFHPVPTRPVFTRR